MENNLQQLRELVRAQMLENGGGVVPQTEQAAANQIGCSQPALNQLLTGAIASINAEQALRLANWLGQPPRVVLRMAGKEALADLIGMSPAPLLPETYVLERVMQRLSPGGRRSLVTIANQLAKAEEAATQQM